MIEKFIKKLFANKPTPPTTQNRQHPTKLTAHSNGNFSTLGSTLRSGGKSAVGLARYENFLIIDHWATRQNTRVAVHESTQARIIVKRKNDTVIGPGLRPDPAPIANILGITPEQAKDWADDAKERFNLWALSKGSDLTGRNNFYQNQSLIKWQSDRDGEYFIRFTYSDDVSLLNPLQISFIDPNQIRGDEFTTSFGPSTQEDGIIHDKNGKETGFKVWINDPKNIGRFKIIEIPAIDRKTGRPLMIHGYKPEFAGQTRGIPEISHGLQEFEDITSFDVATGKKRIMEATLGLTVENEIQTPSDMDFSSINAGGNAGVIVTDAPSASPVPTNLGVAGVRHCEINEATVTEPGTIHVFGGQQGDKVKAIPSATPAEKTSDYVDYKTRYLSASMSMPFTVAVMQMGKAHSASRAELGMLAGVIKTEIADLASDAFDPIWSAFISEEIASGRMKAPGFSDPILRQAWLNMNWTGDPLPDVDPLKTLEGVRLALDLGLTDLDKESMKHNNSSGESNRAKLAKQIPELVTDPFELRDLETEGDETEDINEPDGDEE